MTLFIGVFKCLSRIRGGDPPIKTYITSLHQSFPHTRGGTTCLSAAQCARKHLGAPSLLKVESTVCFQRKRGLTLSKHEVSSAKLGLSRMCGGDPCFLNATILIHLVFPACAGVIPRQCRDSKNSFRLSRIRGGDPQQLAVGYVSHIVFPAYAGVIPVSLTQQF